MRKIGVTIMLLFAGVLASYATHNRAGEITYRQIGPLTIEITITTYTKTSSQAADRDSLLVFWGDGLSQLVARSNGDGDPLGNDVKKNFYVAQHTYPGRGTFTVNFTDPNRVGTILNVNWPNSVDVPFYLGTTFTLLDPQFQGVNNSAILLQPPLDRACVGQVFTHNPNAYDIDGDSLSYELVPPQMAVGEDVPGYRYPDEIGAGDNNKLTIDPTTGMIRWDSPQIQGEYNIAIKIKEWRNGTLLNSIIRDMQIFVTACDNKPPVIATQSELCVTAGDLIDIPIDITDINTNQNVQLGYTGGPFVVKDSPAEISPAGEPLPVPHQARLRWQTNCTHISKQYYQIVLKATDNGFSETEGLSTLHTIRIKVVAPQPEDVRAENKRGTVRVSWASPYSCSEEATAKFQGFSVWRKKGASTTQPDSCTTGIDDTFYQKIVFITKKKENGRYFVIDDLSDKGSTYCYKILAEFANTTSSGNPYNRVESRPSQETCIMVGRNLPLVTKVSVSNTSTTDGKIDIHWTRPLISQLDTVSYPPPYTFYIVRKEGDTEALIEASKQTVTDLQQPIDTTYTDTDLNTLTIQYNYQVVMQSGDTEVGRSAYASSIIQTIQANDSQISLSWSEDVPWSNYTYHVYKVDGTDTTLLTTTAERKYTDRNLINGVKQCYLIQSEGKYGIADIQEPLYNYSQVLCATPMDNVAPCAPELTLTNNCTNTDSQLADDENILTYAISLTNCNNPEPVALYRIYYKTSKDADMRLIASTDKNSYTHKHDKANLGCYAVSAVDSTGNESPLSTEVCTYRCPQYELPNTFTPNDDGNNDIFTPTVNKHVASVDFVVFNTWGNILYKSNEPDLNWAGIDSNGNKMEDGVYYYKCIVNYDGADDTGRTSKTISGYVQIIR